MFVRLLRVALCTVLVGVASGIPHVVLAAFDDDACAVQCDGDVGGKRCPPNCAQGACAKSVFSVAVGVHAVEAPLPESRELAPLGLSAPVLPLVTHGVFHPPRG